MKMDFTPEQLLQMAVVQTQADVVQLQANQKELRVFVVGNGDPHKGLMWLATNQGELLTSLTGLVAAHAAALEDHKKNHPANIPPLSMMNRLGYEALRQLVVGVVIAIMAILILGTVTFVRNGGHL